MRKLKLAEANDGSYAGAVLAAFDRQSEDSLAHEFAALWVVSLIETDCWTESSLGDVWLDLETPMPNVAGMVASTFREDSAREIQYAEARNLLRHHPTRPNLVQIVEK
jgi:hypothetical protein